jgi:hypothetical protein
MTKKIITVAKGLIYKKRVIEAINQAEQDILRYNSVTVVTKEVPTPTEPVKIERIINRKGMDIRELIKRRLMLKNHLMDLKVLLWRASDSIRHKVLRLAEHKSSVQFWNSIDTEHGVKSNTFRSASDEIEECDAVVQLAEVRENIRVIKKEIDTSQQEIDKFNYTTEFEIEDIGEL